MKRMGRGGGRGRGRVEVGQAEQIPLAMDDRIECKPITPASCEIAHMHALITAHGSTKQLYYAYLLRSFQYSTDFHILIRSTFHSHSRLLPFFSS